MKTRARAMTDGATSHGASASSLSDEDIDEIFNVSGVQALNVENTLGLAVEGRCEKLIDCIRQ